VAGGYGSIAGPGATTGPAIALKGGTSLIPTVAPSLPYETIAENHQVAVNKMMANTTGALVNPPNAAMVSAVIPPSAVEPKGKHLEAGQEVQEGMIGIMQDMRINTVERNFEIAESYRLVRVRVDEAKRRLKEEAKTRDEQFMAVRDAMAVAFKNLQAELESAINTTFSEASKGFHPLHSHLDALRAEEEHYYDVHIPETIEKLSGEHVREMEAKKESLVLDDTTIKAREARIVERLETHIKDYDQRCQVEAQDRETQHNRLTKMIHDQMTRLNEDIAKMEPRLTSQAAALRTSMVAEEESRKGSDAANLQMIAVSMERLQREALATFGTEDVVGAHNAAHGDEGKEDY
jgi:hypothetical protein